MLFISYPQLFPLVYLFQKTWLSQHNNNVDICKLLVFALQCMFFYF